MTLIAVSVVITGLYFGREVLVPLALAVVLAFLLTPVVGGLEKCHLGRVPAVLVVLVLAFALLGSVGWIVTGQLMNIVDQFPSYKSNIHDKIQSLRVRSDSRLRNATNTLTELSEELTAVDKKAAKTSSGRPIPVQVAHLNSLETATASFVTQSTRELIEELGDRSFDESVMFDSGELNQSDPDYASLSGLRIVCIPAADEADELVSTMIAQLLMRLGCDVRQLPIASRTNILEEVAANAPQVVVSALPPFAAGEARSLCKRLRQRQPQLKTVLGLWNFEGGVEKAQARVGPGCADVVATSLRQAISLICQTSQSLSSSNQSQAQIALHQEVIASGL